MNRLKIILTVPLLLLLTTLDAQDMQFTQFYASPLYLNCAFTGANTCSRVSLTYRNQWRSVSKPYQSYMLAVDHYFNSKNFGVGLLVAEDEAGSGLYKTTTIRPSFAYGAKINKLSSIRFGLAPGIGIKSVNYGRLLFGDQIYRGGSSVSTVEKTPSSKTFFDLCAGILLSANNYWAGISLSHINAPNESMVNEYAALTPPLLSIHSGIKIPVNSGEHDPRQKKYITPAINFRKQSRFDQVDLGFYFTKHIFCLGMWYRGIPLLKSYQKGYPNNDALSFIAGVQALRVNVGYSYDLTISNLAGVSKGAHEINLSFQICDPRNRKIKFPLISCPKF